MLAAAGIEVSPQSISYLIMFVLESIAVNVDNLFLPILKRNVIIFNQRIYTCKTPTLGAALPLSYYY